MIPPVQSSPISAVTTPTTNPVALARPPITPGEAQTAAAIEANLGGVLPTPPTPPQPPAPRARAMMAAQLGEKWAGELSQIADMSGVNIGNALNFAHADVRRLMTDLNHNAPEAAITRDTNRLLGDWGGPAGAHAFQALRHGMFQNAEGDVRAVNRNLTQAGVTSPQVHGALHDLNNVLRYVDSALSGRPGPVPLPLPPGGSPPGGPLGGAIGGIGGGIGGIGGLPGGLDNGMAQFQIMIDQATQKAAQAMLLDARAHPEHMQAFQGALTTISGSLRQLQLGVQVTRSMQQGMLQDLARLYQYPQPSPQPGPLPTPQPGPQPVPLPWPGGLPQPQGA